MSRYEHQVSRFAGQTAGTDSGGLTRDKPPSGVCPVGGVPGQMSRPSVPMVEKKNPEGRASLRDAMPLTAALVDELRQVFSPALVDRCIARGQHLRREHARIQAVLGDVEANRWLAGEQAKGVWFGAVEGGRTVGVRGVAR